MEPGVAVETRVGEEGGVGSPVGVGVGADVASGSSVGEDVGLGVGAGVDVRIGVGAVGCTDAEDRVGPDPGLLAGASGAKVASSVGAAVGVVMAVGSVLRIGVRVGAGVGAGVSVEGGVLVGSRRGVESAANCSAGVDVLTSVEPQAPIKTNAARTQVGGPGLRRRNRLSLVI